MQLYLDEIQDLLNPRNKDLNIREDVKKNNKK